MLSGTVAMRTVCVTVLAVLVSGTRLEEVGPGGHGELTGAPLRKLQNTYTVGLGDPQTNYVGAGIGFYDAPNGDKVISEGATVNKDGASVLGEFLALQGPSNPRLSAGYIANGQPLGITIGPEKQPTSSDGGSAVNVRVITGIEYPAVDYGEINPGRRLQNDNTAGMASSSLGKPARTASGALADRLRVFAAAVSRRLLQVQSIPLTIGYNDGNGNFVGTSTSTYEVEGKNGKAEVTIGGSTLNLASAPTAGNQVLGEFRKVTVAERSNAPPVVTGEFGAVIGGQPFGIALSTVEPRVQPVTSIGTSAITYEGQPKVRRALLQQGSPIVIGIGDPNAAYIGEANGIVQHPAGAAYTGGATVNVPGLPSDHLAGDFRNVEIGMDNATGAPYLKGQVGAIIGGMPAGIAFSSNQPLPTVTDHVNMPVLQYGSADVSKPQTTQAAGKKLLQEFKPSPVIVSVGDPNTGNFAGAGYDLYRKNGTGGAQIIFSAGDTVNAALLPGGQAYGDFRTVEIKPNAAAGGALPAVYGEAGFMGAGQTVGVSLSTENPLPTIVNKPKDPALPYPGVAWASKPTGESPDTSDKSSAAPKTETDAGSDKAAGRKLQQTNTPLVLSVGDPKTNYMAEGNMLSSSNGTVTYAGGETVNTEVMPGKQLYGDYRSVDVQPYHDNQPYPSVTGEIGYVVAGQPIGLKVSTENPVPTLTLGMKHPVLPYPSSMVDPEKVNDTYFLSEPTTGVDTYQPSDDASNGAGAKGAAPGRRLRASRVSVP